MIRLLAFRNLLHKPWRTAFLLLGYGLGVAVMIVLLSVGEALLTQARQEKLVGGGEVTVLPEGVDVEVLKTGGLGGMFFSIDHARFIYRQLIAAPRLAPWVSAAAPQIEKKLLYLREAHGREYSVLASGEIPSLMAKVGVAPALAAGVWADDSIDRRWRDPTLFELHNEIDHFHLPPLSAAADPSWGEWHYFNVLSADGRRWAFISFIVGGLIRGGSARWGGQLLITLHEQGKPTRRYAAVIPARDVRFSTADADVRIGGSSVTVLPDGRYAVRAHASSDRQPGAADVDLVVSPSPNDYFPGAALSSGEIVSGYVVPALRAEASGRICAGRRCESYSGVQAYHDHNWGVWRGVTWEWGSARAGNYSFLYGRVQPSDSAPAQPLFLYLVDSAGFVGLFRPRDIRYDDANLTAAGTKTLRTPRSALMFDARGDDTLRVELAVEDVSVTDTRATGVQRGGSAAAEARRLARPFFLQMKGTAHLSGRVAGRVIRGDGFGFFETYR